MNFIKKHIYYISGIICIIASVFILQNALTKSSNLTENARYEYGYRIQYDLDFPMPKSSLVQLAAYLPVYNTKDEQDLDYFLSLFGMKDSDILQNLEYFEIVGNNRNLKIYKNLDFIEYTYNNLSKNNIIDHTEALNIATEFMQAYLPHFVIDNAELSYNDNGFEVIISKNINHIPDNAFPTNIVMDIYGNILYISHYYFEYERLGAADIISFAEALNKLPTNFGEKAVIKSHSIVYLFEDSILQPMYQFEIKTADQNVLVYNVKALRFY